MNATRNANWLTVMVLMGVASILLAMRPNIEQAKAEEATKSTDRPKLSVIRLGQTQNEIVAKYGKPVKTTTFASGIESLSYQHGGIRLLVEISPKTKQVIQIYYFKGTPFTDTQVSELMARNTEGSKWRLVSITEEESRYERFDGGIMRGRKVSDEFMLAFLSGSEVRGRDAAADTAREREVEESLKEIE